ncbi:MAG TPA: type 1 glutamine amidotransferase domain-containing protein [Solirubrobacteraceae bacterium]|jgi:putative intracellular protease/amidase|nr:type 1 glutamine amidotransferase domain-containing protein [Solirubrobacteraceae bacterium]
MIKVLMAVSGAHAWTLADGTDYPTGFWAEELVAAHRVFRDAGWEVTIATPQGRTPAVDANSLLPEYTGADEATIAELKRYLDELAPELEHPATLESVDPGAFDVLFLPGGHGPMQDLAVSSRMGAVLTEMLDAQKVVASVCHASAALLSADRPDGSWAFSGYRLTGFTNAEEEAVGLAPKAAWLLESRLRERGASFEGGELWAPHIVSDRNLYTGQNPASSQPLAEQIVAAVSAAVA